MKKLLTLDDLYQFYSQRNESCLFSAKENHTELYVQVPAQLTINKEQKDVTMFFGITRCFHIGENRNKTSVIKDAAIKAMKCLAYKPVLANFCEIKDENGEIVKDFTNHDQKQNPDGTTTYYEKQVGCFTADEPYIEEYDGKPFVYAFIAIPKEYTPTYDILNRKGGTKVSVELKVNALEYNSRSKILELTDIDVMGLTLLGVNPKTGKEVGEGMQGARLDILDFNSQNNSLFSNYNSKMFELQDRLEKLESACFNNNSMKGGDTGMNKILFDELLIKYNKKVEDITFDYENMSDEELTAEFAKMFDDNDTGDTGNNGEGATENPTEPSTGSTDGDNGDPEPTEPTNDPEETPKHKNDDDVPLKKKTFSISFNGETKTFELSCNEKISALQQLVNATYSDEDNTFYGVTVYDDSVVMSDYWNNKHFRQTYTQDGDNFILTGDRVEVFVNYLTKEQEEELANIKSSYSELVEYKTNIENEKAHAEKEAVLTEEKYSVLYQKNDKGEFENEAYAKLYAEMDNYSVEDLSKELKAVFSDYVTSVGTYSAKEPETKPFKKISFGTMVTKPKKRYGNLFAD